MGALVDADSQDVPVMRPEGGPLGPMVEIDASGRLFLIGGFSPSSGLHHFPLGPACPWTGAEDVHSVRLSGSGRLWAWTAVTAAPPGYEGPVPYGLGVVELDAERLRVIGRLTEPDPSRLRLGQPMSVVAERLATLRMAWAFDPDRADQ